MPFLQNLQTSATRSLRQGISPPRLALTLVLGFVLGCFPIVGIPTALCAIVAFAFGLNQPAIQAANYLAMPFQVALIVPLVRIGRRLLPMAAGSGLDLSRLRHAPLQALAHSPQLAWQFGGMAGQALVAWLLLGIPVVVLLTPALTLLLRRISALSPENCVELP